eukprot:COSAG02_NODE_14218_length_1296_cov_1.330827_2_plen_75_part_00
MVFVSLTLGRLWRAATADLLPSFLAGSKRDDDYTGSSIESRAKFPLRVFEAVRAAWPAEKPLGVRFAVGTSRHA